MTIGHQTFPVAPSTAEVAVDVVDLGEPGHAAVEVPYGKILDGREGGTEGMHVGDRGSIIAAGLYMTAANVIADADEAAYADGDLVGSVIDFAEVNRGLYLVQSVLVAALDGSALPPLDVLIYSGGADLSPLTSETDGDAFAFAGFSVTAAQALSIPATVITDPVSLLFANALGAVFPTPIPWAVGNADHPDNVRVGTRAALRANGAIAAPLTGPIALALVGTLVATDNVVGGA